MVNCVVVDDDSDIVDLFCELLESSNVQVLAKGYDGKQAVELYDKFKPEILFVDISMPLYDGIYAVEHIHKSHPNAKIIILTGDSGDNSSYLHDSLKIDFVLHKPFNMRTIKEAITVTLLQSSITEHNSVKD